MKTVGVLVLLNPFVQSRRTRLTRIKVVILFQCQTCFQKLEFNMESQNEKTTAVLSVQSAQLKPCPFCGSEGKRFYEGERVYRIGCSNSMCCAVAQVNFATVKNELAMIAIWNQRQGGEVFHKNESR